MESIYVSRYICCPLFENIISLYAFGSSNTKRQLKNIVKLCNLCHSVNYFDLRNFEDFQQLLFTITKSGYVRPALYYITSTATWENIGKMPRICCRSHQFSKVPLSNNSKIIQAIQLLYNKSEGKSYTLLFTITKSWDVWAPQQTMLESFGEYRQNCMYLHLSIVLKVVFQTTGPLTKVYSF